MLQTRYALITDGSETTDSPADSLELIQVDTAVESLLEEHKEHVSHITILLQRIERTLETNPLRAWLQLMNLPRGSSYSAQYNDLKQNIERKIQQDFGLSAEQINVVYAPLQQQFYHFLGDSEQALPPEVWSIVMDYWQNFAALRNPDTNEFFEAPVIFNHPSYSRRVVEREDVLSSIDDGSLADTHVTRENVETNLTQVTLIELLHARINLGLDWYLLPTDVDNQKREDKNEELLRENSNSILSILEQNQNSNLDLKLFTAIKKAKANHQPFINLHNFLHADQVLFQRQLVRDHRYTAEEIAAMPFTRKLAVMYQRIYALMTIFQGITEHLALLIFRPNSLNYVALGMTPAYLYLQFRIYIGMAEAPRFWRRKEIARNVIFLLVLGMQLAYAILERKSLFDRLGKQFELAFFIFKLLISVPLETFLKVGSINILLDDFTRARATQRYNQMFNTFFMTVPFLMWPLLNAALINVPGRKLYFQHTYEMSEQTAWIPAFIYSSINCMPSMVAAFHNAREVKKLISNEEQELQLDETRISKVLRYSSGLLASCFIGLLTYLTTENPELAFLAALSMLNYSTLPEAIRYAHYPQLLFPAQRRQVTVMTEVPEAKLEM